MANLLLPAPAREPGFDELVADGVRLVPAFAPEWTNHNASDPGITLIELLAYFTDALLYRLGRVSTASRLEFLRLLQGRAGLGELEGVANPDAASVRSAIERALDDLAQLDCAVTTADHEALARRALAATPLGAATRLRCLAQTDLSNPARMAAGPSASAAGQDPGHTSVVVFAPPGCPPQAEAALLALVKDGLEPHRLLTHRLHVITPVTVYLAVRLWLTPWPGADRAALAARVAAVLSAWRPEDTEAANGTLALAEIADRAAAIEDVEGVDQVVLDRVGLEPKTLHTDEAAIGLQIGRHATVGRDSRLGGPVPLTLGRLVRDGDGGLAAFALHPWEALRLVVRPEDVAWSDEMAFGAGATP